MPGAGPERVFKTLLAEVDGKVQVAMVPVDHSLDLKALARAAGGKKAAMVDGPGRSASPVTCWAGLARWAEKTPAPVAG
ncbi:Cys-tRNA(Pro)/Cys-tRNA(Cys) deacylase YbaK [Alcanivorax sp. ALC70]|nr:Cys-tRNA(Pro)/Cys-tRNA(Cys) deacylase YbaK [Alcanivorax sp. ALC70]